MKRLHVHISVADIDLAVRFYSGLFGMPPTVAKPDYAKWIVEDPAVNLAVSLGDGDKGVDHLGIQVEDERDLSAIETRLRDASADVLEQRGATCCYAQSDKSWTFDPDGVAWESFLTNGESVVYGSDTLSRAVEARLLP